ncbi:MAG: hypothetical protein HY816_22835 [Candidatus Wallbacteria bacterium]|nr:hypothetical protein [Candidatus Wallbacteria bacterium]
MNAIRMVATAAAMLSLAGGALLADQRSFQDEAGKSRTFAGFVQYCNPVFLQGFIGEVGKPKPLALRVWVGHVKPRGEPEWRIIGGAPIEANQPNGEGEAVLGFRSGFSFNFNQVPPADRPKAGDLIWVFVARTADGVQPKYWRMFERTVGAGGNANANPDKGESQGVAFFQGRITQLRPDSIRGYALDDLALSGVTGPKVFNPVKVLVTVGKRKADSGGAFQLVEEVATDASEETEIPLYLTDPPAAGAAGTSWKFGFTANLKNRLEPGFEYQVTLFEVSLAQLVLDRRIQRITQPETLPAIASFTVGKGADGKGGSELEFDKNTPSKRQDKVQERMTTRALLAKDELFKRTPEGDGEGKTGFWRPAPELLYRYEGTSAVLARTTLPPPAGQQAQAERVVFRGEGAGADGATGGYSPDKTRNLWLQLIQTEPDPQTRGEKKQYLYDWYYSEPWYETYLYALYRNVKAKKLEETWAGLSLPPSSIPTSTDPGTVIDPDAPPPSVDAAAPTTAVTNAWITIYLDAQGMAPVPWKELDEARREEVIAQRQAKLDSEFNIYKDVELGVGAFSRQAISKKNSEATTTPSAEALRSNPLMDPTTNPSVEDSKVATVTFRLKGDHKSAAYDDASGSSHPLFVSVRYVYDKAVEALSK